MTRYLLYLALLIGNTGVTSAGPMRDFIPGSYHEILTARQDKPFILVFWSLDCPPCHKELALLGQLKQKQPRLDLVLVATDANASRTELQTVLAKNHLDKTDSWVFADESAEALRYEIDNTWYGELPRSYLFNNRHQRQAISGLLSAELFHAWLREEI